MRKGALPIEIVIILILGIVALAGVLAFFLGAFRPGAAGVSLDTAKNLACQRLIAQGCQDLDLSLIWVYDFDANKDNSIKPGNNGRQPPGATYTCSTTNGNVECDNLFMLCANYYGITAGNPRDFFNGCGAGICGCPRK